MDSGQRPADNAWISPELHSRCPDFPAPSSSGRVLTMPSGPSFAGKPALQLPGDQGHQLHRSILTMPRTQNSDNIKVPTPTRRHLFIVFYGPFYCWPNFLSRKTSLQKIPSGDTRPGLFDNRLDENQKRKFVDHSPLPLNPQQPRCPPPRHFVGQALVPSGQTSHRASCFLFPTGLSLFHQAQHLDDPPNFSPRPRLFSRLSPVTGPVTSVVEIPPRSLLLQI